MTTNDPAHPNTALFHDATPFPIIPGCEHFAGSEKLIGKALALQNSMGPLFDITCDCEDGAAAGKEREHAEMVARMLTSPANRQQMAGARIHHFGHPHWQSDIDILIGEAGEVINHLTIPKSTDCGELARMIDYIQQRAAHHGIHRQIPLHILIESHSALHQVWEIVALPWIAVLDFGLMDFVSDHHGAIPASAMRSPGQFEHRLLARAKAEIAAAALAHGVIPAHNVTLDLRNPYTTYADARRAREEFGFLRMWSIHPTQITPIIDAMKPTHDEVQEAAAILLAAQQADWGPTRFAGELHDRATYRYYWEVLQKARIAGLSLPEAAEQAFFGP